MEIHVHIKEAVAKDLAISHLSAIEQEKIILLLAEIVSLKIGVALTEKLSEAEMEEVQKLTDEKEILDYIMGKVPHFSQFVKETTRTTVSDFMKRRAALAA